MTAAAAMHHAACSNERIRDAAEIGASGGVLGHNKPAPANVTTFVRTNMRARDREKLRKAADRERAAKRRDRNKNNLNDAREAQQRAATDSRSRLLTPTAAGRRRAAAETRTQYDYVHVFPAASHTCKTATLRAYKHYGVNFRASITWKSN